MTRRDNIARPLLTTGLIVALLGLSGCTSYSDLKPAQKPGTVTELPADKAIGAGTGPWPKQQWWRTFDDPQLDKLIEEALAGSPSLEVAAARLRAARASADVADAARGPGYTGNFHSLYNRITENGLLPPPYGGITDTDNSLTFNLDYHFDFWGRNSSALKAAASRERAVEAEHAEARLVLTTAVANRYVELTRQYALLDIAREALDQRQSIYDLTAQRVEAGLDTRVELKQAESELPPIRGEIAAISEAINATRYALAALLGTGPDRGLAISRPDLHTTLPDEAAIPANIPAQLLGRRPDIVAARWRVEAADGDVNGARAEFYPNINLSAFVGLSSFGLDKLLATGSREYGVGPAISLPLFSKHTLRGHLTEQLASYDAAVAEYDRSLVEALKEVAQTLDASHWLTERKRQQQAALATAREALILATDRYRGGLGNYLTVLQAQTAVLQRQREGATLDARTLSLRINLIKSLGGGFNDYPATASRAKTQGEGDDSTKG